MIKKFIKFGLGSVMVLALVVSFSNIASATSTIAVNSLTETGALTINAGAATALTLGSSATSGNIVIGGSQTSGTITIGTAGGTGVTVISGSTLAGTNSIFANATTSTVTLASGLTSGTLTIGGAGANVITMGDVTGATSGTTSIGGSLTTGPFNYAGTSAGAADVQTASLSPAPTTLSAGMVISFKSGYTNATTTPTFNLNGQGAAVIVKRGAAAVAAGDILVNGYYIMIYNGTQWQLVNPTVN